MMNRKNHKITFRADDGMYEFIVDVSKGIKKKVPASVDVKSEAVRYMVMFYMMSVLLGEFNAKGLEKRFEERFKKRSG
jgi:hypothetical protein